MVKEKPKSLRVGSVKSPTGILRLDQRKRAAEVLRESETRYRIVADNTNDFEFWINPRGQFIYASPSSKRVTGYDAGDFIKDPDLRRRIVHPSDRRILDHHIKEDEKKHKTSEMEYRLIHADGSMRWISHVCQPVFSDQGDYLGVRGSNRDITDRKRMEEELRRSRDELEIRIQERTAELQSASLYARSLVEASLDPLVTISPDGKVMDVNRATELATGVPRHQLIGSEFSDYFTEPEEARNGYRAAFERGFVTDYPLAIRHVSGRLTEVLYNATVYRNESGKIQGVFAAARDITDRKQTEKELKSASLYARSLIEASLDSLVTISADGKVMDVNRATELETGVARDQLIGSDFSDYFTDPERAREGYKQVFSKGSIKDYPLAIRHVSGDVTHVLYNATVYRNEAGEVQGVLAASRDITERKRTEEALRESEKRLRLLSSQLLATQEKERKLAAQEIHDSLGASLAAIKFKVESSINEIGDGNPQTKIALESLIPIIQGTIEEARRIQMALRPPMLDDLGILATINWFCRQFTSTYSHIHITKEIQIEESEVPDSLKTVIFRVLQEAMNNIAKHSKADRIHLLLRKKDGAIGLGIQDNGRGFDLGEERSRVGTTRGLGLDSMRERVELSRGSFSIESSKGAGAVIRATWAL